MVAPSLHADRRGAGVKSNSGQGDVWKSLWTLGKERDLSTERPEKTDLGEVGPAGVEDRTEDVSRKPSQSCPTLGPRFMKFMCRLGVSFSD